MDQIIRSFFRARAIVLFGCARYTTPQQDDLRFNSQSVVYMEKVKCGIRKGTGFYVKGSVFLWFPVRSN